MSQVTHRSRTLSPYETGGPGTRPLPPRPAWFVEGALAAGLGLGVLTVLVLLLWIVSPYPESSAGEALRIAADLWLLGHGSSLVRTETLSGVPAPIGLTPLLLAVLPVWLLYRAFVQALAAGGKNAEEADVAANAAQDSGSAPRAERDGDALTPLLCVAGGYLVTAAVAVLFASAGPVRADVLSALVRLPLFVVCVALAAMWPAWVRTAPEPPNEPSAHAGSGPAPQQRSYGRQSPVRGEARTLARRLNPSRTALTAVGVLCGGGLLVTLGAVLWHLDEVQAAFPRLAGDSWTGQSAVLLLVLALLPNAAVWAASYGLGPGFALGASTGTGAGSGARLPSFPLLEALPGADGGYGLLVFAAASAVPLAAGVLIGRRVGYAAVPEPGRRTGATGRQGTVCVVALVAGECAAGVAVLAAFSGGALGTGAMASLGPSWWWAGAAAFLWSVLVGVPVALVLRAWRLRDGDPGDEWHATASRRARWTALKTASGGLMPDFEPRRD
ncbi:hypothetical protein K378_00596 [Streptomyces sp. Amel2xB2]|uniref:cell division protein PerM n=1 Tax=Streptomyces sp. Amel2xB2 TaxID=1305829 RepID=UPI000DBFE5D3|nr:DUF6350 family protein [Streptomyces sp. Amel2xB2]RAJ71776.1 hypothetical protein K378_00596 [Streptomyces sp. Amel2xB2]